MSAQEPTPGAAARRLMRSRRTAALATALAGEARPYASLVLTACDHDGSPILLLSRLAEHTRNLEAEPRACLLFDGTQGLESPLTGARASVLGRAERTAEPRLRARFLARHPDAAGYAGFADFGFFRFEVERAHLVAGFGRIHWAARSDVLYAGEASALAAREADIVAHMNEDHADAIQLYAQKLCGATGDGWRMTGCDPEGVDLALAGATLRVDFERPAADAEGARAELVRLVKRARSL
jgi:heme iron utilization protein